MLRTVLAILMACLAAPVFAIGDRQPPASWQAEPSVQAGELPVETFAAIDPQQLRERDADPARMGEPLQFAEAFASHAELTSHGRWDTLAGGDRIWRLRVEVPGATDINVGFSRLRLPPGARLHIYDAEQTFFQGGWDHEASAANGEFWTPVVPGDSAVIELYLPAGASEPELELAQVAGGYRDFFGHGGGPYMIRQGDCNNDVICPEGDPWRDEIRSVAVYQRNGMWACTGTLINDVPGSLTPWFLTADHCGITSGNDQTVVVYWNFESSSCGDLGGGSLADNQTGVIYRASRSDVDMALVELEELPAESFNVHYAGWDRSNTQPGGAVAIHHPNTDEKAISFAESDLATTSSCIGSSTPATHWEVPFWNDGTTEPGSSGSGIWNPDNQRLIGFLSGGIASCSNPSGYDCYGKFAIAWDGASANRRLRDWLDPDGINPAGIDGTDPESFELVPAATSLSQCGFADIDLAVELTAVGSFADAVSLSSTGLPAGVSDSFSPNPITPPGTSQLTLGNLAAAGSGSFAFDINGSGGGLDRSVGIEVTLAETLPAAIAITSPANGATGVSATPTITWNGSASAADYVLEIAEDAGFSNLAYSATEAGTSHT
ncbi:MAG TPA: trypsin-like peptidase domain-containing protein, partial [Wenzhouxiangella sp.]|nr:trypsin-like peptidase domain-containing protein [Wenzhouxiangella sp.]